MKELFKPRAYQEDLLDNCRAGQTVQLITGRDGRTRFVGVDMAGKNGSHARQIFFDEYTDWLEYKWYKNPIKWFKLKRIMRQISKKQYNCTWIGKDK